MKISDLPNQPLVADTDLVVVVDTADFTEAPSGTTKHALVSAVRSGAAGGDLSGNYPNPTVAALQGTAVSAVAPTVDGQVLTWNGSEWVPAAAAAGGSGGGGQTYFFNNGTAGNAPLPVAGVKQLGLSAEAPLTTVTSGTLPNTGVYALVAGFVTDLNKPGLTAIPVGLWDFNVWANAGGPSMNANIVRFRLKVYKWDGVTATLLATSGVVPLYDPNQVVQYSCSALVPQTVLLATDRIYVEIEATATANNHTITVSFGDAAPSHVHTTLPSIAGTGIVHVINGVVQSPASAVNLAGGSAEITGTLPIGNGGTGLATTPTNGQLLIGNGAGYTQATLTAGSGISITNGAGSISIAAPPRLDASFQGEVTGTSATVIGAIYLPAITLAATSRVLAGVVGAGTATIRLIQQSTATVVATWTTSSAIGDVTLGAPTAALAAGWYTFDLAGSGAGTVTRCYGAYLES